MGMMSLHRTVVSGRVINLLIKLMKASFELLHTAEDCVFGESLV